MQCKNCNIALNRKFKYCPECGQKTTEDLTVKVLFSNTISNYFSVDARFFKSFLPLLYKPGFLATKFVEGKRLTYLHPAQFYLFSSVIFFFLFSFISREQQEKFDSSVKNSFDHAIDLDTLNNRINLSDKVTEAEKKSIDSIVALKKSETVKNPESNFLNFESGKIDSLIAVDAPENDILKEIGMKESDSKFTKYIYSKLLKLYVKKGSGLLESFYNTIPISLFFLLPLFAFILKLLFYKRGPFAYNLVFSFYLFSFFFTLFSIVIGINFIIQIPNWLLSFIWLGIGLYLFLSILKFYNQRWIKIFFKTFLLLFLFANILLPISAVVMAFVTLITY
jgi:hypothetical protein